VRRPNLYSFLAIAHFLLRESVASPPHLFLYLSFYFLVQRTKTSGDKNISTNGFFIEL
jgi:hypothetical protein